MSLRFLQKFPVVSGYIYLNASLGRTKFISTISSNALFSEGHGHFKKALTTKASLVIQRRFLSAIDKVNWKNEAMSLLGEVMKTVENHEKNKFQNFLVADETINRICEIYFTKLTVDEKAELLSWLCNKYGVQHHELYETCGVLQDCINNRGDGTLLLTENRLRLQLDPLYNQLFKLIGRLNNGVKYLVDMRKDADVFVSSKKVANIEQIRDLSNHLKSILSLWFSVGMLQLTRITWETPADILEKVGKYEAVHQIRSWVDLKHRLGSNRRCYAFFHSSMPREPLVLLHVALTDKISRNITSIVSYTDITPAKGTIDTAAIFYSITSTQNGLQGIDFGIHMIRKVVEELRKEIMTLNKFSSLSPIPQFRNWLFSELKIASKSDSEFLLPNELDALSSHLNVPANVVHNSLLELLQDKSWKSNENLKNDVKSILMRVCAFYLYDAKRRGYAFDPVANFHFRNGAILWRINFDADPSIKGFEQSFGMMVNYRYILNDMDGHSKNYLLQQKIIASESVLKLLKPN